MDATERAARLDEALESHEVSALMEFYPNLVTDRPLEMVEPSPTTALEVGLRQVTISEPLRELLWLPPWTSGPTPPILGPSVAGSPVPVEPICEPVEPIREPAVEEVDSEFQVAMGASLVTTEEDDLQRSEKRGPWRKPCGLALKISTLACRASCCRCQKWDRPPSLQLCQSLRRSVRKL